MPPVEPTGHSSLAIQPTSNARVDLGSRWVGYGFNPGFGPGFAHISRIWDLGSTHEVRTLSPMVRLAPQREAGHTGCMATFGNLETEVEPLAGLMRDHIEVHGLVTETREAIEEALGAGSEALAGAALEKLRDLEAYLAEDLVIHIAKEEDVLFPALLGFAADIDQVVDEMVEQHDEIRLRRDVLERALAVIDQAHDEVDAERERLSAALTRAERASPAESLPELLDAVKRLDWILQGHFGDEEDDLFVPALELLSPERFAELAAASRALDAV